MVAAVHFGLHRQTDFSCWTTVSAAKEQLGCRRG
jgi:hypothetical protein